MVEIVLEKISKKYGYQTILNNINHSFKPSTITGISGRNGSGKSTLLRIISSYLSPSLGKLTYKENNEVIKSKNIANDIGFCAPYIKVTQEMNLREVFQFQQKFRNFIGDINYSQFLDLIELKNPKDKEIRFFSSGMQQKTNLGLTILSQNKILLLDEPTSYLDEEAKLWFQSMLKNYIKDRTTIIASNDMSDFHFTEEVYHIENGKIDF